MIYIIIALVVMLALGVLLCFRGKRYFHPVMSAALFFFGVYAGVKSFSGEPLGWIVGAVVGAVLVVLSSYIYKVLLFLAGAMFGYLVGAFLCNFIGGAASQYAPYVQTLFASGLGFCALKWSDKVIIISTVGVGSVLLAMSGVFIACNITELASFEHSGLLATLSGFLSYLEGDFLSENGSAVLISALVFYFAGLITQLSGRKKR